jgi:hypothetical protein
VQGDGERGEAAVKPLEDYGYQLVAGRLEHSIEEYAEYDTVEERQALELVNQALTADQAQIVAEAMLALAKEERRKARAGVPIHMRKLYQHASKLWLAEVRRTLEDLEKQGLTSQWKAPLTLPRCAPRGRKAARPACSLRSNGEVWTSEARRAQDWR